MFRRILLFVALVALVAATPRSYDLRLHGVALSDAASLLASQAHRNIVVAPSAATLVGSVDIRGVTFAQALRAVSAAYGVRAINTGPFLLLYVPGTAVQGDTAIATVAVPNAAQASLLAFLAAVYPTIKVAPLGSGSLFLSGSRADVTAAQRAISQYTREHKVVVYTVNHAKASLVLASLRALGVLSPSATATADDARSRIFVLASSAVQAAVASALPSLDLVRPQVIFHLIVLDYTPQNDSSHRGIQWGAPLAATMAVGLGSVQPGFGITSFLNKTIALGAIINELTSSGEAKILAKPNVTVLSGTTSKVQIGANYPIEVQSGGLVSSAQVTYYPVGVLLSLSPQVGADGEIRTTLSAAYTDIGQTDPKSGLPIFGTRSVDSVVTMYAGQSLVLAGMMQDTNTETVTRIPFFSDIPVLGQFFRDRQTSESKNEVVFVLTPTFVNEEVPADAKF